MQNTLKTNFEYNITRRYGAKYHAESFSMFVLKPRNYTGATKYGIVISKKIQKSAVKRNRIKRVFREVIRKNSAKIPNTNLWIVIHPRVNSLNKGYEEISIEFNKVVQNISFPR